MFTKPVRILKEWRLWVVIDEIVTSSLYKEGSRVVYRHDVDADVLEFAKRLVLANPGYSPAYVMDICRTDDGLKMLETNCINAAGFYAADLSKLVMSIDAISQRHIKTCHSHLCRDKAPRYHAAESKAQFRNIFGREPPMRQPEAQFTLRS